MKNNPVAAASFRQGSEPGLLSGAKIDGHPGLRRDDGLPLDGT
ncbi:MAG TPA: hypothetical protein VGC55_08650 [Dokdonella sp.]